MLLGPRLTTIYLHFCAAYATDINMSACNCSVYNLMDVVKKIFEKEAVDEVADIKVPPKIVSFFIVKAGQIACKAFELSYQWRDTVHITGDGSKVL